MLMVVIQAITTGVFAQKLANNDGGTSTNWKSEICSNYFYIRVAANSSMYWDLPGNHPETAKKNLQFQIWTKDNDPQERTFIFPKVGNIGDVFAIKNKAGFIVDVAGKTVLSTTELVQEAAGKKFKMKKNNSVEIQTWSIENNGVQQWQQWEIVIIDKILFHLNVFTPEKLLIFKVET